jgi:hypothetical protein
LPIAVATARDGVAPGVWSGSFGLDRLRDNMPRRLGLVIIEARVPANAIARADLIRALMVASDNLGCAVLFVSQADPAGVVSDGVILEAETDRLTLAKPAAGSTGWTRAFSTRRIRLAGGEALAIERGNALACERWQIPKRLAALLSSITSLTNQPATHQNRKSPEPGPP